MIDILNDDEIAAVNGGGIWEWIFGGKKDPQVPPGETGEPESPMGDSGTQT